MIKPLLFIVAFMNSSISPLAAQEFKGDFALGFVCDEWPNPSLREKGKTTALLTPSYLTLTNGKATNVLEVVISSSAVHVYHNDAFMFVVNTLDYPFPSTLMGSLSEPQGIRIRRVPLGGSKGLKQKEISCS
jgi:hypothetical protein